MFAAVVASAVAIVISWLTLPPIDNLILLTVAGRAAKLNCWISLSELPLLSRVSLAVEPVPVTLASGCNCRRALISFTNASVGDVISMLNWPAFAASAVTAAFSPTKAASSWVLIAVASLVRSASKGTETVWPPNLRLMGPLNASLSKKVNLPFSSFGTVKVLPPLKLPLACPVGVRLESHQLLVGVKVPVLAVSTPSLNR